MNHVFPDVPQSQLMLIITVVFSASKNIGKHALEVATSRKNIIKLSFY